MAQGECPCPRPPSSCNGLRFYLPNPCVQQRALPHCPAPGQVKRNHCGICGITLRTLNPVLILKEKAWYFILRLTILVLLALRHRYILFLFSKALAPKPRCLNMMFLWLRLYDAIANAVWSDPAAWSFRNHFVFAFLALLP